MTTTQDSIDRFCNFIKGDGRRLAVLRYRWEDERDYEDFADYKERAEQLVAHSGFHFKSWSKRGTLTLTDENGEYQALYRLSGMIDLRWRVRTTA